MFNQALEVPETLKELVISSTTMYMKNCLEDIKSLKNLKTLSLSYMGLYDEDLTNILSMIKVEKLCVLNLHGNFLKNLKKGEFSILSSFTQMENLEHLDLG